MQKYSIHRVYHVLQSLWKRVLGRKAVTLVLLVFLLGQSVKDYATVMLLMTVVFFRIFTQIAVMPLY